MYWKSINLSSSFRPVKWEAGTTTEHLYFHSSYTSTWALHSLQLYSFFCTSRYRRDHFWFVLAYRTKKINEITNSTTDNYDDDNDDDDDDDNNEKIHVLLTSTLGEMDA
jgi:hypothetical protein